MYQTGKEVMLSVQKAGSIFCAQKKVSVDRRSESRLNHPPLVKVGISAYGLVNLGITMIQDLGIFPDQDEVEIQIDA